MSGKENELNKVTEEKDVSGWLSLLRSYRTEIMGLAALWIYIYHCWITTLQFRIGKGDVFVFITQTGYYGVDIFFLVSGFGLVFSMGHNTVLSFYRKRVLRVYIPFLITGLCLGIVNRWEIIDLIKRVSGYSFYNIDIYSLLWFVPAIMTVYLFFPFYYKLLMMARSKIFFTGTVMVIWYFITMICGDAIRWDILHVFLYRLPIFWIGCYFAAVVEQDRKISWEGWVLLLFVNIVGICCAWDKLFDSGEFTAPFSQFLIAISIPFLLGGILQHIYKKKIGKIVRSVLLFFGKISLEFYCVQEAAALGVNKLFEHIAPRFVINLLITPFRFFRYAANLLHPTEFSFV